MTWKIEGGDWKRFRRLPGPPEEIDFHFDPHNVDLSVPYEERMTKARERALEALKTAQKNGANFVIFTHGSSTSHPGKATARSVVRGLMKSKDATPYIVRRDCICHETVFVAAVRPTAGR